ncbi:MAG: FAD-binding oxidoreductase [Spirochaetia bacterium]|nr:FAD-binding oxidoreductase [Spirochaetia bacterium]
MTHSKTGTIHIIGGGIAGISSAYTLTNHNYKVCLWEKEKLPCMYASSRNAAIARSYESDPVLSFAVKKGLLQMIKAEKYTDEFIKKIGLLFKPLEVDYYEDDFISRFPEAEILKSSSKNFQYNQEYSFDGLYIPANGTLDIHNIQQYLLQNMIKKNILISYEHKLIEIARKNNLITNLVFVTPNAEKKIEILENDIIVNATGSWAADSLFNLNYDPLPVLPYKRHLFQLSFKENLNLNMPVLWDEQSDTYLRPEGKTLLATHCDENETNPDDYNLEEREVEKFQSSIINVYPFLKNCQIKNYWACLRTFSKDNRPVVGFDAHIKNFFYAVGWGGRGMSLAFEIGNLVSRRIQVGYNENETENDNPYTSFRFL